MYARNIVSVVLLNLCLSSSSADKTVPLLEAKQDEKKAQQKQLQFDKYKALGCLSLMSHGSWAQGDSQKARQFLVQALAADHEEAARFYAARVCTLAVFNRLAADGDIDLLLKLLPLLCRTPEFEVRHNHKVELSAFDCSGLVAAICPTHDNKKKSEEVVKSVISNIIDFYNPQNDQCIDHDCWRPCISQCQDRCRAFLSYGLAKAGELAIKHDYLNIVKFIYQQHKAFPTLQAIQAAQNKENTKLITALQQSRDAQLTSQDIKSAYTLLRKFSCIADVSKQQRSPHFISDYARQLAWPVIKNIRYSSWVGNLLSGVIAEPLACTQAYPREKSSVRL